MLSTMTDSRQSAYRLLIAEIYEIAGLSRKISDRDAATVGSTAARWHLLSVLSEKPATVPHAAGRLGQARQSVQRVADDLVAATQLRRRPNPVHARSPLYEITAQGVKQLERLWLTSNQSRSRMLDAAVMNYDDLAVALEQLRRLRDALRELDSA
jgi:DNA-binding MarR family transcriptional regulator